MEKAENRRVLAGVLLLLLGALAVIVIDRRPVAPVAVVAEGQANFAASLADPDPLASPSLSANAAETRAGARAAVGDAGVRLPGWRVRGMVMDGAQRPITGATIVIGLQGVAADGPLGECTSGANGSFQVDLPRPPGSSDVALSAGSLVCRASAPGFRECERVVPALRAWQPTVDVEFVLPRPTPGLGRLAGRIVDEAGRPVAGAQVLLWPERTRAPPTGHDGEYELAVRLAGRHFVQAFATNVGVGTGELLELQPRTSTRAPDVVLRGGKGVIGGRAVTPEGRPVRDLVIRARPRTDAGFQNALESSLAPSLIAMLRADTRTDDEGRFRLEGLRLGAWRLNVSGDSGRRLGAELDVETGDLAVRLVVNTYRIHVRVRDTSGRPVPGASGSIQCAEDPPHTWRVSAADGTVVLHARPGRVRISASTPASVIAEKVLELEEFDRETQLNLVLAPRTLATGTLRVLLDDARGAVSEPTLPTLLSLHTLLCDSPLPGFQRVTCDASGRLGDVPAGNYRLTVHPTGSSAVESGWTFEERAEVEIVAGQETSATVSLRTGGRLSVSVITRQEGGLEGPSSVAPGPGGTPLAGGSSDALIVLHREGDSLPRAWERRLLEPGTYRLTASRPGCRTIERSLVIEACRTTELEIRLEPE